MLVGSSAGGEVAMELLQRHPDLTRGVVISEPTLFSLDPEAAGQLVEEVGAALQDAVDSGGLRAAVDAFFDAVCLECWALLDEEQRERRRDNASMLFAMFELDSATITTDDLAAMDHPVLVFAGTTGPPALRRFAQLVADHLSNARFIELKSSGHVPHAEQPDAFVHEIAGVRSAAA